MPFEQTFKQTLNGWNGAFTQIYQDFYDGNADVPVINTVATGYVVYDTMTGYKLPNYKSIIRSGGNATTSASGVKYSGRPGFYQAKGKATSVLDPKLVKTAEIYGNPAGLSYPDQGSLPAEIITKVSNRAISKFISRANSVRSSVEAGQDFGELKEALKAMTNPAGALRDYVLSYFPRVRKLKARYRKRRDLKKALADTYLEWTFGWKPLAQDIADAYVGIQNANNVLPAYPIEGGASETYSGATSLLGIGNGTVACYLNVTETSTYQVRIKGVMRTRSVDNRVGFDQVLQLELPDFLPTAWDLLPYSFIVDYFTNIGDIVSAYSFRFQDLAWVCMTNRTQYKKEFSTAYLQFGYGPPFYDSAEVNGGGGNTVLKRVNFTRGIPDNSALIPSFAFSLPTSKKPWINMGALLVSNAKSIVPVFR